MMNILRRMTGTFAALAFLGLVVGQVAWQWHWFFELFSHFLPHYAVVFLIAALLVHGIWRWLYAGLTLLLMLWLLQPLALWEQEPVSTPRSLLWYNVHLDNVHAQEESKWILAESPKIVALAEIDLANPGWQMLLRHYPHGCMHEEQSPFALALRSREPLAACEVYFVDDFPLIRALATDGVAIYALHPPPPIHGTLARSREDYLRQAAQRMAKEKQVLAVGDLNSSPFSPLYREMLHESGTVPLTPYWTPTWKPFLLNIDHILSRSMPARAEALPWMHSDHRPLRVYF